MATPDADVTADYTLVRVLEGPDGRFTLIELRHRDGPLRRERWASESAPPVRRTGPTAPELHPTTRVSVKARPGYRCSRWRQGPESSDGQPNPETWEREIVKKDDPDDYARVRYWRCREGWCKAHFYERSGDDASAIEVTDGMTPKEARAWCDRKLAANQRAVDAHERTRNTRSHRR